MSIEGRLLIVENDPDLRKAIGRHLRTKGYKVFAVEGPGAALKLLNREHIHIAIIDIRLDEDSNVEDRSGLELAKRIQPPVLKLILTGYPGDYTIIRKSFKEAGAIDFVAKQEGPQALLEAIERAFREKLGLRGELEIGWDDSLSALGIAEEIELSGIEPQRYENEVTEVLLKLFSVADKIVVTHLLSPQRAWVSSQSGAVLLKVTPYYNSRRAATKAVKLAERRQIETEVENYDHYVKKFVETHRYASQEDVPRYTLRIGGIVYALLGTDLDRVQDLSAFYERHGPSEINALLETLFTETCQLWYKAGEVRSHQDIPMLYKDALHLTPEKIEKALKRESSFSSYRPDAPVFNFPEMARNFINPITWLERHFYADTCFCVTHGDMHSHNILVDESKRAWLIDFTRTGEGHILRDFIEMESDVKFALLDETSVPALCEFEVALLSPERLDQKLAPEDCFQRASLNKAFAVVSALRALASRFYPGASMEEYYQALLYQTLNVIRLRHIRPWKKRHALLAAALTCERLQNWDSPWPPADIKK